MKIVAAPLLVLLVGIAVMALYAGAPRMLSDDWRPTVRYGDNKSYFEKYEMNVNPEARRFDLGLGLTSAGASLLAIIAATRSWSVARIRVLRTPRRRWQAFVLSNVAWLYYIWATGRQLMVEFRRGEYPSWADSMGIPWWGAQLPVPMWAKPRTLRAWVLNSGIAVMLVACAWAGIDAVRLGDPYTLPAVAAASCLLLVGRAAACAA